MTDKIREEIRIAMIRQRVNQIEVAKKAGLSRQQVSNLLTGQRGDLLDGWARLLDALGLELTITERADE